MGRERKNFIRRSGFRDARLFVIATEGEKTEPSYFHFLKSHTTFQSPRIHIEIIPSLRGESSPQSVLRNLDNFKKEYKLREDDQLWMLIDRDVQSWSVKNLKDCKAKCRQKKYKLCLSNPNFEIWILLHFCDIHELSPEEKLNLQRNAKIGSRSHIEIKIIESIGSYNKSNLNLELIYSNLEIAINNNLKLTSNNTINLIDNIGTDINLLLNNIRDSM